VSKPSTIAIDGPSAAGKTTLARQLAETLGYLYFDTGVMYRAVTLVALRRGIDLQDEAAVTAAAWELHIDVLPPIVDDGRPSTVLVDGEDVTWRLREADIDASVSIPSAYAGVRAAMTGQQRRIAERGQVVMVGRDIGTVVLPDADLKLYIDATVEERARRRWEEHKRNGRADSYESILAAMRKRDRLDSQRAVAPLRPADDAIVIDTTEMDAAQMLAHVMGLIEQWSGG
jgi:cytidylate kinase